MLDYIVMQIRKTNREKGNSFIFLIILQENDLFTLNVLIHGSMGCLVASLFDMSLMLQVGFTWL